GMLEAIIEDGRELTVDARAFFREMEADMRSAQKEGELSVFRLALAMSWLTLHALYGHRMDDAALSALRTQVGPGALVMRAHMRAFQRELLTDEQCMLCLPALPEKQFVGRERDLGQAERMLSESGHLLVSGIGGIGKSEMCRMLLSRVLARQAYPRLAFVQYHGSLSLSFARAFPGMEGKEAGEVLDTVRSMLSDRKKGPTLLCIDNVDVSPQEDSALESLYTFGCDMLVTSRLPALPGFRTLRLAPLNSEEGKELFCLQDPHVGVESPGLDLLMGHLQGHPLAISLLASLCKTQYWLPEDLTVHLQRHGIRNLPYVRDAQTYTVDETLRQVFDATGLSREEKNALHLFAVLPYRAYRPDRLLLMAGDVTDSLQTLCVMLQRLSDQGWLSQSGEGYSMHPVIAEAMRCTPITCDDLPRLFAYWNQAFVASGTHVALDAEHFEEMLSALSCMDAFNDDGACIANRLESSMVYLPVSTLPQELLDKHKAYLEKHTENRLNLLQFIKNEAYWAVLAGREEKIISFLRPILHASSEELQEESIFMPLCNVLEYVDMKTEGEVAWQLLEHLRPQQESWRMLDWYATASALAREEDIAQALAYGEAGMAVAERLHIGVEDISYIHLTTRFGPCLARSGSGERAAMLLREALENMLQQGYQPSSPSLINTQLSLAETYLQSGDTAGCAREIREIRESLRGGKITQKMLNRLQEMERTISEGKSEGQGEEQGKVSDA
ncbi:MAG: ATP-binding protein, partial [Clostridia bacterium]|nr:ATP-binding protein [Clostridia bacterium]